MTKQEMTKVDADAVPAPMTETGAILAMIGRMASDPAADIDKFERAMQAYERLDAKRKEEAFNAAMSRAQAGMPQVKRDKENSHTKSWYASLEAICDAATPVYTREGFSLSFGSRPSSTPGHHGITCVCAHDGGHSRVYDADLPADVAGAQGRANKTAIQGFGSTMSYGRRYLTCLIFNIAIRDEDDDGQKVGVETISLEDAEDILSVLRMIAKAEKADIAPSTRNFCDYLKVDSIDQIPADMLETARDVLRQKFATLPNQPDKLPF